MPLLFTRRKAIQTCLLLMLALSTLALLVSPLLAAPAGHRKTHRVRRYRSLHRDYQSIHRDYQTLRRDYQTLRRDYRSPRGDYRSLKREYEALQREYRSLGPPPAPPQPFTHHYPLIP